MVKNLKTTLFNGMKKGEKDHARPLNKIGKSLNNLDLYNSNTTQLYSEVLNVFIGLCIDSYISIGLKTSNVLVFNVYCDNVTQPKKYDSHCEILWV